MVIKLYTIEDRVAEECGPVFCAKNDGVAIRQYRSLTREVRPEEFRLWLVGSFDPVSKQVVSLGPEEVMVGKEVVE